MDASNNWNWLQDLEAFQHSRDSLLSRSPTNRSNAQRTLSVLAQWAPVVELSESDKEYVLKAYLSEVMKEDVKVTANKGILTIVAVRRFTSQEKDKEPQRVKLACGSFGRTFLLPDEVSLANLSAEFKDGVLVVRLGKGKKAGPEEIELKLS